MEGVDWESRNWGKSLLKVVRGRNKQDIVRFLGERGFGRLLWCNL